MSKKTEPSDKIKKIKVGSKDDSGYEISDVMASGNEYAIYEIETDDINKKLRFQIDGVDDESEKRIVQSYIKVKEKYIIAKGLLYRSANYGLMRNRVAHTLATAFSGSDDIALEQFDRLINEINKEYRDTYVRRIYYISPGYLLLTISVIILVLNTSGVISLLDDIFFWFSVATAAIVGGVFSLTLNLPKVKFDSEIGRFIFAVFGIERVSISILAGIICTIGIKSKFILANVFHQSQFEIWALLFVVIASAFSETFVPNIIANLTDKVSSNKSTTKTKK